MGIKDSAKNSQKEALIEKENPSEGQAVFVVMRGSGWSTGLCECSAQPGGCALGCVSLFMPFVQYGVLAEQLPKDSTKSAGSFCKSAGAFLCLDITAALLNCSLWPGINVLPTSALLHMDLRRRLRNKYGITGGFLGDLCTSWWCGPCALAQETREMVIRAQQQHPQQAPGQQHLFGHMFLTPPALTPPAAADTAAYSATSTFFLPTRGVRVVHPSAPPATGIPVGYEAPPPPTYVSSVNMPPPPPSAPLKDIPAPTMTN